MADSIRASKITEYLWSAEHCKKYLPLPKSSDHKYRRGVLCCITGSKKYPGAALLTTASAISVGIGMVRYVGPKSVAKAVIQNRAEVVLAKGAVDAYLLGSGISNEGISLQRSRMSRVKKETKPVVLDAGALYLAGKIDSPTIITPHSGELGRLLDRSASEIDRDRNKYAVEAAKKFHVTVLLKGSETIVTNGSQLIELPIATSWLSTAGTGDVLAGILGALLAINHRDLNHNNLIEVGATAAFIHAAAAKLIDGPISPTKLIESIPNVIKDLSK